MSYTPPNGNEVAINFKDLYTPPVGNEVAIEFNPSDEPSCIPDWHLPSGNSLFVDFVVCNEAPSCDQSWIDQQGANVQINFGDCDLDWVEQQATSVVVNFDSGVRTGDWTESIANQLNVDFNCCEEAPDVDLVLASGRSNLEIDIEGDVVHTTRFSASGFYNTYQISVVGAAQLVTDIYNAWGDCQFAAIAVSGSVQRGNRAQGKDDLGFSPITVIGEATVIPAGAFTAAGDIKINAITVSASVQHLQARYVSGDITLSIAVNARVDIPYDADGFYNVDQIKVDAVVQTLITEAQGDCYFDEITCAGEAEFTLVPTVLDTNLQLAQIKSEQIGGGPVGAGVHVYWSNFRYEIKVDGYVATPFEASGDSTFDQITVAAQVIVDDVRPDYNGVQVYPTFTRLRIVIDSEIIHPFHAEGDCSFAEITISSQILASVVASSNKSFANIRCLGVVNSGIDTLQTVIMQLYEISNNQTMDIIEYPKTAKFAVYVPTTLYNIQNVELRRGTVEYTVEYAHERDIISKIILWVMDENGVATKDTYVTFKNEQVVNYELDSPFRVNFNVSIPLHCVTDRKNKFFLEIIYDDILDERGFAVVERESRVVEFQAHTDNKDVFVNTTDRIRIDDGNSLNTVFDYKSELPTTVFYNVDDELFYDQNSSVTIPALTHESYALTSIELNGNETILNYDQRSGNAFYTATFYNLDTGQIGG